jgi:hypothetical protein
MLKPNTNRSKKLPHFDHFNRRNQLKMKYFHQNLTETTTQLPNQKSNLIYRSEM